MDLHSQLLQNAFNENTKKALMITSFSEDDMNQRLAAYDRSVSNFEDIFRSVGSGKVNADSQFIFAEGMGNANLRVLHSSMHP